MFPQHPPEVLGGLGQRALRGDVGLLLPGRRGRETRNGFKRAHSVGSYNVTKTVTNHMTKQSYKLKVLKSQRENTRHDHCLVKKCICCSAARLAYTET